MLPAPARIAAAPSPNSRASCNPAVPPPPVGGAAVGIWLVDEVGVAVAVLVTVAFALDVAVRDAGELVLTPGVLGEDVLPGEDELRDEAVLPEEAVAVGEP